MTQALQNNVNKAIDENQKAYIYYLGLGGICLLFGLYNVLDYILTVVCIAIFAFNVGKNYFLYTYFALIFFESVVDIPGTNLSLFVIVEAFYILRVVLILFNKSAKINVIPIYTLAFGLVYVIFRISIMVSLKSVISVLINLSMILIIASELVGMCKTQRSKSLSQLLLVVSVFAMLSGIYGLYNGVVLDFDGFKRFSGTIGDPNYSSLLYNLGFSALYATKAINWKWKSIIAIPMLIALILTVSISGMVGFAIISFLYLLIRKPKLALLLLVVACVAAIGFLALPFGEGSALYGFQHRIKAIIEQIFAGNFDAATSGRTDIWAAYIEVFNNLPTLNKIFGGLDTISGPFRDQMVGQIGSVAHNSYIDMLYSAGILGTTLILAFMVFSITKSIVVYYKDHDTVNLGLALTKITLLYYSLNLSIYPYRYFVSFMLI